MTCIVGLEINGDVILAADSMGGWTSQWMKQEMVTPKLASRAIPVKLEAGGGTITMGLGYTASYRMGDLLRHQFEPPPYDGDDLPEHWVVCQLIPAIRTLFKSHGFATIENNSESGGEFLLAIQGQCFIVGSDFSVVRPRDGYAAIGSGVEFALGAMAALQLEHDGEPDSTWPDMAVRAAARHNAFVGGAVHEMTIRGKL
jgi:ATP-dependent protease HslVU (ClpYQ) peptidase subunit